MAIDPTATSMSVPERESLEPVEAVPRPWPAGAALRRRGFQVVVDRSALDEIHAHGHSAEGVEICGVVAGLLCRDEQGEFLHIQAAVRGTAAESKRAQVTFTADTWTMVHERLQVAHPDLRILGWYHTHPDFGVFLSSMDLFIQQHFFNLPWQVAMVYDPVREEDGIFVWRGEKVAPDAFILHTDTGGEGDQEMAPPLPPAAEIDGATAWATEVKRLEQQLRWMRAMLALLAVVAVLWPLWLINNAAPRATLVTIPSHAPVPAASPSGH